MELSLLLFFSFVVFLLVDDLFACVPILWRGNKDEYKMQQHYLEIVIL